MFRRVLSAMLIGVMTTSMYAPAFAEGVSAGDLLFGTVSTPVPAVTQAAATPAPTDELQQTPSATDAAIEGDIYGDNDTASVTAYQILQLGDRDQADGAAYIVLLQKRLAELGFLMGAVDGVFGEATKAAVEQFQKLNGLEQTGIADVETQQLLFSATIALVTPSPENPVVDGAEAMRVQTKLSEWGFLVGSVDGKLGAGSEKAIKAFRSYIYLDIPQPPTPSPEPTPSPTPVPTAALGELPSVMDELLPTPTPSPTPFAPSGEVDDEIMSYVDGERPFVIYRETVQQGDDNAEVKRVRTRLKQLGYLHAEPDTSFGSTTELALKYFQRKHNLSETGIADEATQQLLFSAEVKKAEEYVFPYKMVVDISEQRVYAYKWDGESYSIEEKKMICSTGKDDTPTPTGTYQSYGRMTADEWYYFKAYNCYAKWAYGIVGGILFHSVTYNSNKELQKGTVKNLGRKASHGCIRLEIEDAKWIYDNCPLGTTVVIQE